MSFNLAFEWRRFFNLDLYLFLSLLYGTQVFFRSYSGTLPAMFFKIFRSNIFIFEVKLE